MGLMRRSMPGNRPQPLLVVAGLCVFCFLLGFFTGGSLRFAPQFDSSQAGSGSRQVPAVAPRRLQAHQQQISSIHKQQSSSSHSESGSASGGAAALIQPPQTHQQQQEQKPQQTQQQQAQQHSEAPAPRPVAVVHHSQLPDHETFTKQCLEQTGLLQLRPPIQPAASGNAFYTLAPYQILSWYPRILVFPNFVSPEQARHVVALASGRMRPSGLAWRPDEVPDENQRTRTSTGVFLSRGDDSEGVLAALEEKIASATMLPVSHGEAFNVLHYQLGQRYESHVDYFDPKDFGPQRSQRMATVLLYLSEVEEGGETVFKREGEQGAERPVTDWSSCEEHEFKYKPRMGDAVLFFSLDPDLSLNPRSLHGGCAVSAGEKWVATKWIHEKPV